MLTLQPARLYTLIISKNWEKPANKFLNQQCTNTGINTGGEREQQEIFKNYGTIQYILLQTFKAM